MSGASTSLAERDALRESLRSFFAKYSPESEVRRVMVGDSGYDPALWRRLVDELALPGFAVPTEYGGSGFGAVEQQIVLEEMGRVLLCAPYLASAVLATNVLLSAGDPVACGHYLPGLCAGEHIATVAALGATGRWDGPDGWECAATPDGDRYRLSGRKYFVLDVVTADLLLVAAGAPEGPTLFAVDASAAGITRATLPTLDETRKLGWVEFAATPAAVVGAVGQGAGILERGLVLSAPALAAEQVGGARRALEMAVAYAKVREQFGRLIGSFQAIKHKCADMLLAVEVATSTAGAAAAAIDSGSEEHVPLAHMALALSSESFVFAATENIEVHGGIGFTWESAAQLYYKRAVAGAVAFGSASAHREQLLTALGR
jgi:alkylation response protein AidB-like acyl-CoA dehydrogenase